VQYKSTEPTERTYAELKSAYDVFNRDLFDNKLPGCLITLQREKRTYGYFSSARFGNHAGGTVDEIALNPEYFAITPLMETMQTIAHEMCHQWQLYEGTPGRGRYHNAQWADKMESIGLMPSKTGKPGGQRIGDQMADYPVENGKFAQIVNELSDGGFGISWYDRYTPAQPLYALHTLDGDESFATGPLSVAASNGVQVVTKVPLRNEKNRSNRLKYACPVCEVTVWAKPSLEAILGCRKCDEALLVIE
jgi:predicted SprT family Zn-dependent metalloprotease